ncbi:hypothetical protein CBM2589_B120371 [Cupriavidus taiwanensis]|uniref:Uncharacterized protein n=1 Tax=Cupriavidus taiwanensis TaxID=164546 RepID=A0A975WV77_9BURK|nr:hypothetical protein CBM2589_B120371 [Cupriavidus taiwanensis]
MSQFSPLISETLGRSSYSGHLLPLESEQAAAYASNSSNTLPRVSMPIFATVTAVTRVTAARQ